MDDRETRAVRTPAISIGIGIFCVLFTVLLTARIVWEETALTIQQGPQMIGFSLAHGYYAPLLLAPFVTVPWLIVAVIVAARRGVKRLHNSIALNSLIGLAVLALAVLSLPETFWQRVFIAKFAESPHAADLMTTAAAEGHTSTVVAYLNHGVPLEATNREGSSAVFTAAVGGRVDILKILAAKGADLNATNLYGDSPLEAAEERKNAAANYLRSQGAKQIRGSDEQHEAATQTIVRRDIESMSH